MKRFISFILTLALGLSLLYVPAGAAQLEHILAADKLYGLGLVSGTGTDAAGKPIYELDRAPTRSEAITVLVKLLGRADEASKGGWQMPFTDVPDWAKNFVGYAYANGLTSGTSATTFGGNDPVTAAQYITFVLKALGYSATEDFSWDKSWELSDQLGITDGRYNAGTTAFLRGDVFLISEAALHINVKGTAQTLAQRLIADEVFRQTQFNQVYDIPMPELTAEQIYAQCSPAVFFVEVYDKSGQCYATGSGFFLSKDGLAVTNHHVLDGAARAVITTSDTEQSYEVSGVYDFSQENDWVVMQVAGSGFASLDIAPADTALGGATVYAIGSPKGLQNTISQGLISNPDREVDGVHYIQTSAPISPGSSGGALINKYGQVVGITSAGFTTGQNLNLAMSMTKLEGMKTTKLQPISVVTPKASVSYTLSAKSVTVEAGSSTLISLDLTETGMRDVATYSLRVQDTSVANAKWDDMDDDTLPWDIRIEGYKAGTTNLVIFNDKTDDTVTVPIKVTKPTISVSYQLSASSVTVQAGGRKLISFQADATGLNEVVYSLKVSDNAVANAMWDDMDDNTMPWDIRIEGYRTGTTQLIISNDKTSDTVTIPITVTGASASGGGTVSGSYSMVESRFITARYPLHLYSNDGKVYLGKVTNNKYDTKSIFNEYGSYGSKYSSTSIFNEYGTYGSRYSTQSAFNEYASKPPVIVDANGSFVAYLTANEYKTDGVTLLELVALLTRYER